MPRRRRSRPTSTPTASYGPAIIDAHPFFTLKQQAREHAAEFEARLRAAYARFILAEEDES